MNVIISLKKYIDKETVEGCFLCMAMISGFLFFIPSQSGSTLRRKNLLLHEQILSFESSSHFGRPFCP